VHGDQVFYVRDKEVRSYDMTSGGDVSWLNVRSFGSPYIPPRTLSYNPAERGVLLTITSDNGLYELANLPRESAAAAKAASAEGKRGAGSSAIFVARNRLAVLNKTTQVAHRLLSTGAVLTLVAAH
jgi:coatomer protein complex subunit alpha (xenin)